VKLGFFIHRIISITPIKKNYPYSQLQFWKKESWYDSRNLTKNDQIVSFFKNRDKLRLKYTGRPTWYF